MTSSCATHVQCSLLRAWACKILCCTALLCFPDCKYSNIIWENSCCFCCCLLNFSLVRYLMCLCCESLLDCSSVSKSDSVSCSGSVKLKTKAYFSVEQGHCFSIKFSLWKIMSFVSVSGVQIEALKRITKADIISWLMEHRHSESKRLSVHVSTTRVCVWVCVCVWKPFTLCLLSKAFQIK